MHYSSIGAKNLAVKTSMIKPKQAGDEQKTDSQENQGHQDKKEQENQKANQNQQTNLKDFGVVKSSNTVNL